MARPLVPKRPARPTCRGANGIETLDLERLALAQGLRTRVCSCECGMSACTQVHGKLESTPEGASKRVQACTG